MIIPFNRLDSTTMGFKKILQYSEPISPNHQKFLKILINNLYVRNGKETYLDYTFNPILRKYLKDSRYRIAIFQYNNDRIVVLLKDIRMNLGQYIRAMYFPISLNNNRENEIALVKVLYNKGLINQFVIPEIEKKYVTSIDDSLEFTFYDDYFYSNIMNQLKRFNNRFLTKNRISKVLAKPDIFRIESGYNCDSEQILELESLWNQYKEKKNVNIFERTLIRKIVERGNLDKDFIFINCYFKEKLFWTNIFIRTLIPGVMDELVFKSAARINNITNFYNPHTVEEREILRYMITRSSQQNLYFASTILDEYNVDLIGQAGCMGNKGIRQYKLQTSSGYINFHKTNIFNLASKKSKQKASLSKFVIK